MFRLKMMVGSDMMNTNKLEECAMARELASSHVSRDKRGELPHSVGGGSENIKTLVPNTIMTYYISLESS